MSFEKFKDLELAELLHKLEDAEKAQYEIYATYRRAADVDVNMRKHKEDEKIIRVAISMKTGVK